mgnify:CR=1 FL=1|tara:strand:- start:482 stop:1039 length:558 start_codon:yes stop_codon:yes gene_type:complete
MRRGFKTQAEKLALRHRSAFGVEPHEKINPKAFLESIGLVVWKPEDIPGISPDSLKQLMQSDPDAWSGVTVREGPHTAIIVNSVHPPTRQASTLMHEWAHIELRHKPSRADRSVGGLLLLSDYPAEIEEEADWLAGCILAPREGLLHLCSRGLKANQVAVHYGISLQMSNWRIGKTGVMRQLGIR